MRFDLRQVPSHVLQEALERIERGRANPPWGRAFDHDLLRESLARLDAAPREAVAALLSAVLQERAAAPRPADVVWTGPEPAAAMSRDTAAVVAGMFGEAMNEVLVACYTLDKVLDANRALFAPLHAAMAARGVKALIFFDVEKCAEAAGTTWSEAMRPDVFLDLYWPFGPPVPALYYDPRALEPGPPCSMHAKMVVVDRRSLLVGSANLTDRGQTRNIELGVKIDDPALAQRVAEHWMGAVARGRFQRCVG